MKTVLGLALALLYLALWSLIGVVVLNMWSTHWLAGVASTVLGVIAIGSVLLVVLLACEWVE